MFAVLKKHDSFNYFIQKHVKPLFPFFEPHINQFETNIERINSFRGCSKMKTVMLFIFVQTISMFLLL